MANRFSMFLVVLAQAFLVLSLTSGALAEYEVIEVGDGCSITGSVKFTGDIPKREMLVLDKDMHVCGTNSRPSNRLIIDEKTRGIKNVVVYIENVTRGKKFNDKWHFVLNQEACEFTPHIQMIPVNSTLEIRNRDPMAHNVHAYPVRNSTFNVSIPSRGVPPVKTFGREERIKVRCDRHGWMSAWIVVMDSPYYCLTGEDGTFEISGIPPGDYRVCVWHEAFDNEEGAVVETEDVKLKPNLQVKLDFKLSLNGTS